MSAGQVEAPGYQPGDRVGRYEIAGLLARGGMGAVYRARDLALGRDVALKFLPVELAGDPERLARFEHEARAVAALSHPHIVALHDIGREGGIVFLVMELLTGETLGARLARGALPLGEAVAIAVQVAEALAAAHRLGIVHRDLKPANVMLTRGGVKLLDFGVAKQHHRAADLTAGWTQLPTVAEGARAPLTAEGALVGTLQYMAPEQLEGRDVDARTDLFAFGALVYEMVTGRPAFGGSSPASVIAGILKEQPPRLGDLVPLAPPALERLIERCMAKDPEERWQSAADVAEALRWIAFREPATVRAPASAVDTTRVRRRRMAKALTWGGLGLAVVLTIGAAAARVPWWRLRAAPLPSFQQLTFRRGYVSAARFTPDGTRVVYSAAWNGAPLAVYSLGVDGSASQMLDLPEAHLLSVSSRGELAVLLHPELVDWRLRGVLARTPLAGGAPRELLEDVEAADWAPDGERLAAVRWVGERARLEFPLGSPVYTAAPGIDLGFLRFSPDGSHLAFLAFSQQARSGRLMIADVGGGPPREVTAEWPVVVGAGIAWTADGKAVLTTGAGPRGERVLRSVGTDGEESTLAVLPVDFRLWDRNGDRLLLDTLVARREAVVSSPRFGGEQNVSWLGWSGARAIAADGGSVLFSEDYGGVGNRSTAFLRRADARLPVRLGDGYPCDLSADGGWAIVRPAETTGLRLLPTGPGNARELAAPAGTVARFGRFTADGEAVVERVTSGEESHLYLQSRAGGPARRLATDIAPDLQWAVLAGGTVVFHAKNGEVIALPFAGMRRVLRGVDPQEEVVGSTPDGGAIFLARPEGLAALAVSRFEMATGTRTSWRRISPADPAGVLGFLAIVGRDGESYAYSFRRVLSDLSIVEGWR